MCQELQTLLEEKRDEIDMEENAYMELSNKAMKVYNSIVEQEYVGIYYHTLREEYGGEQEDIAQPTIKPEYSILQLTDDEEYAGHSTRDLRSVLFYKHKINRETFKFIKNRVESFDHMFQHTVHFLTLHSYDNCGYTIFKVLEI